ncbi:g4532 [Coccomyxa elongata]
MQTSAQFYTLRLTLGLAESGAYPGMWYSLALFYDDKELGVAYTTVAMATSVSGVLGGPIAAGLLSLDGLGGLHGWQWLFLLEGVPAIALGIAIWCALAHSPDRATFLAPEERVWLVERRIKQSTAEAAATEEVRMDEKLVVSQVAKAQQEVPFYQSWCIWYLGLVWTLVATGLDGIVFWGPILIHNILDMDSSSDSAGAVDLTEDIQETGISTWATVQAALLSAIPFGLASICMLINARLAKKAEERQWHGAVPLLLGAVALALMPAFMGHVTWLAFVCLSLAAAGIWAIHGPLLSWPAAILQGTNAAAGFALMKMMGSVGSFCGPFLIGALSDEYEGSFVPPVLLLSGFLLLASVLHFLFREPGSGQGLLPRFPYSCGRVMKRSRSDINTITMGPTLRRIFGTRELNFQRWSSDADAFEGRTIDNKPGLHSTGQHPAAHLLGEDTFLWEKHNDLPRF